METTLEQRLALAKLMGWKWCSGLNHPSNVTKIWRDSENRLIPNAYYLEDLEGFPSDAEAMQALDAWIIADSKHRSAEQVGTGGWCYDCKLLQGSVLAGDGHSLDSWRDAIVTALLEAMGVVDD